MNKILKGFIDDFREWTYYQHDVVCNQKYNKTLKYSFHLMCAESQVNRYSYLLKNEVEVFFAVCGIIGHDTLEDCHNLTYNDIVKKTYSYFNSPLLKKYKKTTIADIIYACTELKGKDRDQRHGEEYIFLLQEDRIATFDKLCDISANMLMGKLTNSSMLKKYRLELPHLRAELCTEEFREIFDDLEKL